MDKLTKLSVSFPPALSYCGIKKIYKKAKWNNQGLLPQIDSPDIQNIEKGKILLDLTEMRIWK